MSPAPRREDEHVHLTLESRYLVRSVQTRESVLETEGTFKGVVSVGSIDALAMQLDEQDDQGKPRLRIVPTHTILSIDILKAVPKEEESKDEAHMHYT